MLNNKLIMVENNDFSTLSKNSKILKNVGEDIKSNLSN